jgi:thioredoxin reductase (NADPH)
VLLGHTVTAIEGSDIVEKIKMVNADKKEVELELSGVFVYLHGNKPITEFITDVLERGKDGCIQVKSMMETSIPGVFAAGDVTCAGVRQVVVAASQGCIAALSAEKYIFQRNRHRIDWGE